MNNTYVDEAMKTISARLPHDDVELFQLICEEYRLTQSETIRFLIQAFIQQTFATEQEETDEINQESTPQDETLVHDFKAFQKQKEAEKFYENFRRLSREKQKGPKLMISNL